ncbi:MAG: FAD-dependent thymidylate synthase [Candidatus Omnitrophica bacterium]|nr:FAD-dependent thymidylate synthase [Candidatus Omnitrophota bacterium]
MKEELKKELKKLCFESKENKTNYYSLKDIKVSLIDYTINPYKSMFNMSLMTWGNIAEKWSLASPQLRFEVVKKVLEKKALPLALEAPYFVFLIENVSRASFDQIARARIGVVFAAKGYKDNFLNSLGFCFPNCIDNKWELAQLVSEVVEKCKEVYCELQKYVPNWAARCVIPHYSQYSYMLGITYKALQELCSKRMQTTEMEDTVATAWLLRERVKEKFPLLAEYLRPMCDILKKDTTLMVNGFYEELGIPHISDNRQPGFENYTGEVLFKEPCTNIKIIEKELKIKIPKPNEWKDFTWETLEKQDKILFETQ